MAAAATVRNTRIQPIAAALPKLACQKSPVQAPSRLSFKPWSRFAAAASIKAGFSDDEGRDDNAGPIELKHVSMDSTTALTPVRFAGLSGDCGESPLRVAYQGLPGAYSESAATKVYPNCIAVPCDSFESAFQAVETWIVDRAVIPIENSVSGSIHRNYDLLLRHNLHIVGEVQFAVGYCLLANHGVKMEQLNRVLIHPQALAQCERTLTKLRVSKEHANDTAGAAKFIADNKLQDAGAVASSLAAKMYGLNVLAENIQDDSHDITRFLVLARDPIVPSSDRPFKTSIIFSAEHQPSMLFRALGSLALRNINLSKIESRPLQKKLLDGFIHNSNGQPKCFEYLFHIDFELSMASSVALNAIKNLKEHSTFVRVLGSYPIDAAIRGGHDVKSG